jgi:hypothetical protein
VLTVPQALDLEQVEVRGLLQEFDHVPGAGRPISVARTGFKMSGKRSGSVDLPPPALGEHTDAVLANWATRGDKIAALRGRAWYEQDARRDRRRGQAPGGPPKSSTSSRGKIGIRGYPIQQLIGELSFPQMIWLMLRGDLPTPAAGAAAGGGAGRGSVDHGPHAPSIAISRMAVTCGLPNSTAPWPRPSTRWTTSTAAPASSAWS